MKLGLFLPIIKYTVPFQSTRKTSMFSLIYSFLPSFLPLSEWTSVVSSFLLIFFAYVFSLLSFQSHLKAPSTDLVYVSFDFSHLLSYLWGLLLSVMTLIFHVTCYWICPTILFYFKTIFPPIISLFGCLLSLQSLSNFAEDLRDTEAWSWGGYLLLPYNPASLQLAHFLLYFPLSYNGGFS